MIRGEIYLTREKLSERGGKGGYYVIVSRNHVATSEDVETVVCAPIYSRSTGIETEVPVSSSEGVQHDSAIRCDFLISLRKDRLRHLVGALPGSKLALLDRALAVAIGLLPNH